MDYESNLSLVIIQALNMSPSKTASHNTRFLRSPDSVRRALQAFEGIVEIAQAAERLGYRLVDHRMELYGQALKKPA